MCGWEEEICLSPSKAKCEESSSVGLNLSMQDLKLSGLCLLEVCFQQCLAYSVTLMVITTKVESRYKGPRSAQLPLVLLQTGILGPLCSHQLLSLDVPRPTSPVRRLWYNHFHVAQLLFYTHSDTMNYHWDYLCPTHEGGQIQSQVQSEGDRNWKNFLH